MTVRPLPRSTTSRSARRSVRPGPRGGSRTSPGRDLSDTEDHDGPPLAGEASGEATPCGIDDNFAVLFHEGTDVRIGKDAEHSLRRPAEACPFPRRWVD